MSEDLPTIHTEHQEQSAIGELAAPRELLEMFQSISFPAFKIWICLLTHHTENHHPAGAQEIPVSNVWNQLGGRLSLQRLENRLQELQTTLIKRDEYLPTTKERQVETFQALGPTKITSNIVGDVTCIEYQILKELDVLLKESTAREKFIIELKTIMTLSGDQGGAAAKNLMFLCTPYVHSGKTPAFELTVIQQFMNLENKYNNKDGTLNIKAFMRDVIKKAVKTVNDNPYISFQITDIAKILDKRKTRAIIFHIEPKPNVLKPISSTITEDTSSPINPDKLKTIFINYWTEHVKDNNISLAPDILKDTLREFRLVDSYVNTFFNQENYQNKPTEETYKIMSVCTAIFQSWMEGTFRKESSKIYAYTMATFNNIKEDQILSLVKKFLDYSKIKIVDRKKKIAKEIAKEKTIHHVKELRTLVRAYIRYRFDSTLGSQTPESIKQLDSEFLYQAKNKKFGIWIQKGVEKIGEDVALLNSLTRKTLEFYKKWLVEQHSKNGLMPEQSIEDFLHNYPTALPHLTYLNISTNAPFISLETFITEKIENDKQTNNR